MEELNQGEQYDEYGLEAEDTEAEGAEDTGIQTIYGIPRNMVFLGGAVALVIILFVGVVLFKVTRKPKEEEIVKGEAPVITATTDGDDTVPDIFAEQDAALANGDLDDGYDQDFYEDDTPFYKDGDINDEGLRYSAELDVWVTEEDYNNLMLSKVSTEEMKQLRLAGYTGDEIDFFLQNDFDIDALLQEAQAQRDEQAKEALKRMSDQASPEFKYILDNTYMGQPENPFVSQKNVSWEEYNYDTGSYTVNADYVKCPAYGTQLYIKVRVAVGTYVWYNITPKRYDELPESGNIIVRVEYDIWNNTTYVKGISEVNQNAEIIDSSVPDNIPAVTKEEPTTEVEQ